MRICSKRPTTKQAKLQMKGILPARAMPAPTPTMLPSAMPTSKKRSGCLRENSSVIVDFRRSASRTTMSGLSSASRVTVSPKVTRVAVALM